MAKKKAYKKIDLYALVNGKMSPVTVVPENKLAQKEYAEMYILKRSGPHGVRFIKILDLDPAGGYE